MRSCVARPVKVLDTKGNCRSLDLGSVGEKQCYHRQVPWVCERARECCSVLRVRCKVHDSLQMMQRYEAFVLTRAQPLPAALCFHSGGALQSDADSANQVQEGPFRLHTATCREPQGQRCLRGSDVISTSIHGHTACGRHGQSRSDGMRLLLMTLHAGKRHVFDETASLLCCMLVLHI